MVTYGSDAVSLIACRTSTCELQRIDVSPCFCGGLRDALSASFELTPLHHRLLAVMAADPFRVFATDELLAAVWRRIPGARTNAANTSVSRVRRALVRAGAPRGAFMLNLHGVGWALTRPA